MVSYFLTLRTNRCKLVLSVNCSNYCLVSWLGNPATKWQMSPGLQFAACSYRVRLSSSLNYQLEDQTCDRLFTLLFFISFLMLWKDLAEIFLDLSNFFQSPCKHSLSYCTRGSVSIGWVLEISSIWRSFFFRLFDQSGPKPFSISLFRARLKSDSLQALVFLYRLIIFSLPSRRRFRTLCLKTGDFVMFTSGWFYCISLMMVLVCMLLLLLKAQFLVKFCIPLDCSYFENIFFSKQTG